MSMFLKLSCLSVCISLICFFFNRQHPWGHFFHGGYPNTDMFSPHQELFSHMNDMFSQLEDMMKEMHRNPAWELPGIV